MFIRICIIYFVFVVQSMLAEGSCNTGELCKKINECKMYPRLGKYSRLQMLRKYCGFDGSVPMFCCPVPLQFPQSRSLRYTDDIRNKIALLPNDTICGIQYDDKIYNGMLCAIDEHAWTALLQYTKRERGERLHKYFCGGVLISSRYVLTAAHCVKLNTSYTLNHVRLGEWNIANENDCQFDDCADPILDVPIEQVIAHKDYDTADKNYRNDIALIRLAQAVKFSDFVKPICLPITKELLNKPYENWMMEVAGWGSIRDIRFPSVWKLKARIPVSNQEQCEGVYKNHNISITDKQMCAGLSSGSACKGDSGGGLVGQDNTKGNWYLFGIVSFGSSPCAFYPTVYTRVTAYRHWILSNIQP